MTSLIAQCCGCYDELKISNGF